MFLTSMKGKKHTADFYRHLCNTNTKEWHISDTKFIHPDNIYNVFDIAKFRN